MKPQQVYIDFVVATLKDKLEEDTNNALNKKKNLQKEKQEKIELKDKALDLLLADAITPETYKAKLEAIANRILAIDSELKNIDKGVESVHENVKKAGDMLFNLSSIFASSKIAKKNEILKLIVSNLECLTGKPDISLKKPYSIFLESNDCNLWLPSVDVYCNFSQYRICSPL